MATTPTLRTSTKRPGLARHRDSGSSRSFPQRSDDRQARNRRLRNPRREKVCAASPLSFSSSFLLSLTTTIVVVATSSLPGSFPHSLHHSALPPTIVFSPQPWTVYKQILPPFQRGFYDRAGLGCSSGSTWSNERGNERAGGNVAAAGGAHQSQTALRKIAGSQRKRLSRL